MKSFRFVEDFSNPPREAFFQLTDAWIVFDAQIDVFLNTEAKSATSGKVALFQFVFLKWFEIIKKFLLNLRLLFLRQFKTSASHHS